MSDGKRGIVCPLCQGDLEVAKTIPDDGMIVRRKRCKDSACTGTLVTIEVVSADAGDPVLARCARELQSLSDFLVTRVCGVR
jgi:hypothetical protein